MEQQTVLKYEPVIPSTRKERWAHVVTSKTKSLFLAELNQAKPERDKPAVKPRAETERTIVESNPLWAWIHDAFATRAGAGAGLTRQIAPLRSKKNLDF